MANQTTSKFEPTQTYNYKYIPLISGTNHSKLFSMNEEVALTCAVYVLAAEYSNNP